jgi:hypothetical protein
MWVELARRWAARGLTVVRADLPGLHESPGASPRRVDNNFLYREESIAQTKALVEAVRRDGLPPRVILGGFCAGSYWALHAAVGDPLVSDLMLVNLWIVRWEAKVVAERMAVERAGNLRQRVVRRLRSRELTLAEMRLSVRKVMHERRSVGRPAERAQNRELVHILDRLAEQGTDMALLFTEREALLEQMRRAGLLDRLDDFARLHVDELRVVDHNLWAVSVQASVHAALDQALERALERPFAGTLVPGAAH